jgi:hypothetical protein
MATVTFTPPRQWEDWCDWALGIFLVLSPWILQFHRDGAATRNAVIVGLLVVFAEVVTLSRFQVWEEWINVVLGAWLAISPFVLGIADPAATTTFVVLGLLIAGLAVYEVIEVSRSAAGQTTESR